MTTAPRVRRPALPRAVRRQPGAAVAESVDEPTVLAQVPVGSTPGFAATPPPGAGAGQQLYVANRAAGVLTVVDTATNAVRGTIPIDDGPPQYVAFSRDGTRAYVSVFSEQNSGQNNAVNRVVVVDTLRGGVVASIPVGTRPYALAVTPDATGSEVWVPNHDAASVSIIDTATNTVTRTLPVAPNPHWVAFSPDGTFAYTANHESNLITVLDVATKTVVGAGAGGQQPAQRRGEPHRAAGGERELRRPLRLGHRHPDEHGHRDDQRTWGRTRRPWRGRPTGATSTPPTSTTAPCRSSTPSR